MATRSCLRWIGGKGKTSNKYVELMPEHRLYVEPFCGACHVALAKEEAFATVVNDINDLLIDFLYVLQSRPEELLSELDKLPYSESLYNKYKFTPWPDDEVERAVRFYYIVRAGFAGGGNKYRTGFSTTAVYNKARTFRNSLETIIPMAQRIKNWAILCRDFEDVIQKFDGEDSFFFCDPPYFNKEDLYKGGFEASDHERLKNALDKIKGKAMVCYYDEPFIRELYKDYVIMSYNSFSTFQTCPPGEQRPKTTELIILNYEPAVVSGQQMRLG